jgi:simple sugar transport system ATP-binding protein
VREELLVAACRGLGVLLISEDLDEIYTVADVIVVMYHGSIVARIMPSESRPDEIGLLMSGVVGAVEPREGGAL